MTFPKIASKRKIPLLLALFLALVVAACRSENPLAERPKAEVKLEDVTIRAFFSAVGAEAAANEKLAEEFEAKTGVEVEIVTAPQSTTDNLTQQLQFLSAGSSDIDVYQIDVIWPGILAEHAVNLKEYIPQEEIEAHFPAIVKNNIVEDKLVGLPWFTGAGLLYYRTDLLEKYGYSEPPEHWDGLEEMAQKIQAGERAEGNRDFWGFVWQGNNYEGLTTNALEWQYSHNGGRIIEPEGIITINNPNNAAALARAAAWVDTISPPEVITYQEEEAREVWQSGNAAFMRNWTYAYALGNQADSPIKGKFEVAVLPTGAELKAATLGGWQLMVSKYSKNPEVAAQFVRYMAGPEAQKFRAISISHLPTIGRLYKEPEILAAQPFMERLFDVFNSAVARPSTVTGELYSEVSLTYFNTIHSVLTGAQTAEKALADLEEALVAITGLPTGPPPEGEVGATRGTLTGIDAGEGVETEAPDNRSNFLSRAYEGASLKVFFSAVGNEAASYGELIKKFTEQTGIEVEVVTAPDSATDNLAQQLQFLEAGFTDLDVYQIDVTWPGLLADHAVDLYDYIPRPEIEAHFPAIIANNTVEGKLVGLPWFTGAGLLYYRTDLLEKYGYVELPESWDELVEIAETIQEGEQAEGNNNFWGFVWQGSNYEGLTCNALEWQVSEGGGRIIEPDGTITVNNPEAAAAFTRAAGWIDTISPLEVITYRENEAWEVWQSGNALFMRNWPYAYALGNSSASPIKGRFEAMLLPAGASRRGAATLGGWQLMVSQYSDNIEPATLFVRYMAGREAQAERAARDGYLPTIAGLYSDPEVLEAQPFMGTLFEVFTNSVARPSTVTGALYNEVSKAYFNSVHSILTGEKSAEAALLELEKELVDITGFEVGRPP